MNHLQYAKLDLSALLESIADTGLGGTAVFLGSVRSSEADGPVVAIDYSAYDEMASGESDRILAEAHVLWPGTRVALQHRLGSIPVGEYSIAVAAASAHRNEAFEACRWVVEQVKQRVPIWKKEQFQDGTTTWRGQDGSRRPATST
jgi:molybdopterin synthase catalytic subunit